MSEKWKAVNGFEGYYEVSESGAVKSLERYITNRIYRLHKRERLLKPYINESGYASVVLCKDGRTFPSLVHRLVAEAFLPNPDNKPIVDHIDTDPSNNKVENLRWVTVQENCMNELTRQHNSDSKTGHKCYLTHHSEETKRKLSELHRGKVLTEEHKRKLSESHKGKGIGRPSPRKGKHWKMEGDKRIWY